ncbi:hypothetical protein BD560DRAFT_342786, partial [Blakeslea trispora]
MALSTTDPNHIRKVDGISTEVSSSTHNPNNQPFTFRTWAQMVKVQKRQPLSLTDNAGSPDESSSMSTTIFLQATEDYSIAIDAKQFEGINFSSRSLNLVLRDQFPKGVGLRDRRVGRTQRYIEIGFETAADRLEALSAPFKLQDDLIKMSATMDGNARVVRIGISNIPFGTAATLQPRLLEIFHQFGEILEIGLKHTAEGEWFNGRGYVTLNRDVTKSYKDLTTQVQSWKKDHNLHLVWSDMKPICTFCHVDDHIRINCPALKPRRKACFICDKTDHLRAACPLAPWNANRKR